MMQLIKYLCNMKVHFLFFCFTCLLFSQSDPSTIESILDLDSINGVKRCFKFIESVPKFSEYEYKLIEEYYPKIAKVDRKSLVSVYLYKIKVLKNKSNVVGGYKFYFSFLSYLQKGYCLESNSGMKIVGVADRGYSYTIDISKNKIIINSTITKINGMEWDFN